MRPVEDAPTLVAVTRRQLEAASRADTPAGVSALLLAARLDAGGDTGSAIAALSKQHLTALADALADAPSPDDAVDEARARRQKRLRA